MPDTVSINHLANQHPYVLHMLWDFLMWTGGAITALATVFKVLIPIGKAIKKMIVTAGHIETIVQELVPNGGGSMKDQITQISKDVVQIKSKQTSIMLLSEKPMFWADINGGIVRVNKELTKLFGATQEQLMGSGWMNFLAPEDRERIEVEWDSTVSDGFELNGHFSIINGITEKEIPVKYFLVVDRNGHGVLSVCGTMESILKDCHVPVGCPFIDK